MLSIIVATAKKGVIGCNGQLPWHLSADLRRFRKLTTGHSIVMGRKTYASIGRPLPDRRSIVLSRNPEYAAEGAEGVEVVGDFKQALDLTAEEAEVFVIGGGHLYQLALPFTQRIYLTEICTEVEGDVHFPQIDWSQWDLVEALPGEIDEKSGLHFSFKTFNRRSDAAQG
jgi:dihydrofolate reductase